MAADAPSEPPGPTQEWIWRRWQPVAAGVAGLVLAALLAPAEPVALPLEVRWVAAYLLFVGLPGWLLVTALLPSRPDARLETALLCLASGYGIAIMLGLLLHLLFRPIAPWQIAVGAGLLVVGLAVLAATRQETGDRRQESGGDSQESGVRSQAWGAAAAAEASSRPASEVAAASGRSWAWQGWALGLVVLLAGFLRLWDIGWSEFQGDEARVVLRAMAALQGAPGALAAHRKVPGEIMLAYLFAGGLGQILEPIARLPFALAGVGAVAGFYVLARALFSSRVALVAALLLAVNGYFVAFGRILQYDNLAFFLGILGLVCAWRFGQERERPVAWAFLSALLLASAILTALGAIFLVPPALLLGWAGLVRYGRDRRVLLAGLWPIVPAGISALLVLGSGDSDPGVGPTGVWSYLGPRLGGDRPYWNGADFLVSANHYLSSPYLLALLFAGGFVVLTSLFDGLRLTGRRGMLPRLLAAVTIAAITWERGRPALAIGAVLALLLVLQRPGQRLGVRVALLWAAGPLLVHLFLIRFPGTHWREVFPGLTLLLAFLTVPTLSSRTFGWASAALLGGLVLGAAHFDWVTLIQRNPEYQMTYPSGRHPLDWTTRDGRGIGGVFGVAHHHGWKALGVLVANGTLPAGYTTNESPAIAAYYLRRPPSCPGTLTYGYRVPRAPQDRGLTGPVPIPAGYQTRGQVQVAGRNTIAILAPPGSIARVGDIRSETYQEAFDRQLGSVWSPIGELYRADLGAAAARRACGV